MTLWNAKSQRPYCTDSNGSPKIWESEMSELGKDDHFVQAVMETSLTFDLILNGSDDAHLFWGNPSALLSSPFQMLISTIYKLVNKQ